MKNKRQSAILQIISAKNVETQNQLIEELEKIGIESTQATVSRDIKTLHLIKELTPQGVYRYVTGQRTGLTNHSAKLKAIFRESVISYVSAQSIVVIKTLPGLAPAVCSAIDGMVIKGLAGTIAGDDTAFLAMADIAAAERFCRDIEGMLE